MAGGFERITEALGCGGAGPQVREVFDDRESFGGLSKLRTHQRGCQEGPAGDPFFSVLGKQILDILKAE